jgi:hypothetical protein
MIFSLLIILLFALITGYLYQQGTLLWIPMAVVTGGRIYSLWYNCLVRRALRQSETELEWLVEELRKGEDGH